AIGFEGPNVGFIARVTPKGHQPAPLPDLAKSDLVGLIGCLTGPQSFTRVHAQSEIMRRGRNPDATKALLALASDKSASLEGRVVAIFTLSQLEGKDAHPVLVNLAADPVVREFALRALTDRNVGQDSAPDLNGQERNPVLRKLFVAALADESPRVRAQALIGLNRLNDPSVAKNIIPLTARPKGSMMPTRRPLQDHPAPDP